MFAAKVDVAQFDEATEHNKLRDQIHAIVEWDRERLQFTPDYNELQQRKSVLVFIHDDMAQLQSNHDMVRLGSLSGFYPFMYGYTTKKYTFVKKNLGLKSFPIALDLRDTEELPVFMTEAHRIRGEVYAIRPPQMIVLDTHRQNGVQFRRVKVNINIGYQKLYRKAVVDDKGRSHAEYNFGKEEMCSEEMMMYVGREEYWKDQLKAGFFDFKPIDIFTEDRLWLKEYYQYSRVR